MVFHCLIFNCFGCLLMKYKVSVVWQLNRSKISSGLEKPVFFCQIVSNIHRLYSAIYGVMGAWRDCVMKVSVSKSKNQTIKDIMLKYSSSTLIKKESCRSVNVGYLFLKDIRKRGTLWRFLCRIHKPGGWCSDDYKYQSKEMADWRMFPDYEEWISSQTGISQ